MAPGVCMIQAAAALVGLRRSSEGQCSFANEPQVPYFWDPSCPDDGQSLGCLADGIHPQCRFCGEGPYADIHCPASWCEFNNPPHLPYFWDSSCTMGTVGCLADGTNIQCRFCGEYPYNGTVACPGESSAVITPTDTCDFDNEPTTPYFWDATCADGMLGCNADGKHLGCRFCGAGNYAEIDCPPSLCTFTPELSIPTSPYRYYWEPECWDTSAHILGCLADNIHAECRYCGTQEYESIPCPDGAFTR